MSGLLLALLAAAPGLRPVKAGELCVTLGSVADAGRRPGGGAESAGGRFAVEAPKFRAVAPGSTGLRAALLFELQGNTARDERLGSGALRRQLGLKLLAENGCNVLYVMWRLLPVEELVVQLKRNPGLQTHAQCGNKGYSTMRPRVSASPPKLVPGEPHLLEAALSGGELRVTIDSAPVWEGTVDAAGLRGPAGVRSDNLRFSFSLLADGTSTARCARPDDGD